MFVFSLHTQKAYFHYLLNAICRINLDLSYSLRNGNKWLVARCGTAKVLDLIL